MIRLTAILLLALLCAAAALAQELTISEAIDQLKSDQADTRWAAVQALAKAGAPAVEPIFDLLSAQDKYYLPAQVALRQLVSWAGRPGAAGERMAVASAILTQMRPDRSAVAKRFGLELLSQIAAPANAPALGRLLFDPEIGEMARWTLVRIPGSAVTKTLIQALADAPTPEARIAMLGALGARQDPAAARPVQDCLAMGGRVREAAMQALARIPSRESRLALEKALAGGSPSEQAQVRACYLRLGETLAAAGDGQAALEVCRRILATNPSEQETCQAMWVLGQSGEADALNLLCDRLAEKNDVVRGAVRNALVAARGSASDIIAGRLTSAEPGRAVTMAWILGERRERGAAVSALCRVVRQGTIALKVTACQALGKIADPAAAQELLWALSADDSDVQEAAEGALAHIPGPRITDLLSASLAKAQGDFKCALVRSLGYRADASITPVLVAAANDPDPAVRATALAALADRPGAESHEALYLAKARDSSEDTAVAALQALTKIKSDRAEPLFMELAQGGSQAVKPAALYGYLVLADKRRATDQAGALAMFKQALALAGDDDNGKRLALAGLAEGADASCLPLVLPCLEDEGTRQAAAPVLLPIAAALAAAGDREQAISLYQKVVTTSANPSILQQAARQLRELGVEVDLAAQAGFITNWWVVGPFEGRPKWSKEDVFDVTQPVDLARPITLGDRTFAWKHVVVDDPSGGLDFRKAVAQADEVAAYGYAEVTSPTTQQVTLAMGSDDGIVVWLNETKVHTNLADRGYAPDQDRVEVTLRAGVNRILMKVINGGADWMGGIRILNENGEPVRLEQRKQ